MPLADPATSCTIVADVRLDNREELLAALDLEAPGRVVGDGEILLRAWLAWGEGCLDRLLGDFAFAIWDARARRLFAARDQMGMRQLIHAHVPGHVFAFATDISAVLAAPGLPYRINEGRIADYLEGNLEGIDLTSTFFEGVFRLPPAHCLTVDAAGLTIRRYWSLEPGPPLDLPDDEAYAQAFLEVFTEAVRCRLRSAGPVGSMLSGGMDSGSVVAVASRLLAQDRRGPLPVFSLVGPDPDTCVETRAIRAAQGLPNLDPHVLDWAEPQAWRERLLRLLPEIDEPFDGHISLLRGIYSAAHRAGVKVVLDGACGDSVLSHGDRVPRLIRAFRWRRAWAETRAERLFWSAGWPAWRIYLHHLRRGATPGWARRLRGVLRRGGRDAGLVSPDFARRVGLVERQEQDIGRALRAWVPTSAALAHTIGLPYVYAGRERYDRIAGSLGVEPRDPFMDRRVVAFCLRLPSEQLARNGWPKFILRRAMAGLLPDEVRWRRGKQHLGFALTQAMFDGWPGWTDRLEACRPLLDRYVRQEALMAASTVPGRITGTALADRMQLMYLALWLDRHDPPCTEATSHS